MAVKTKSLASATCEETTGMIGDRYLRCGAPSVGTVAYTGRDEGPYAMCLPCLDHNTRNRGGYVVAWLDQQVKAEYEQARTKPRSDVAVLPPAVSDEIALTVQTGNAITQFMRGVVEWYRTAKDLEQASITTLAAMRAIPAPQNSGADVIVQTMIKRARANKTAAVEHSKDIGQLATAFHKWVVDVRKRGETPADEAMEIGNALHNGWTEAEKRRAAAENERLRLIAEADARAKRAAELARMEADAEEREANSPKLSEREELFVAALDGGRGQFTSAQRAGYSNPAKAGVRLMALPKIQEALRLRLEARAIREQASAVKAQPLDVQVVDVRPDIAKAEGASDRTTRKARVLDEDQFIEALIAGKHGIPRDCVMVNRPALNGYARALGVQINRWPGVQLESTTKVI